jgi:hypothetical protein
MSLHTMSVIRSRRPNTHSEAAMPKYNLAILFAFLIVVRAVGQTTPPARTGIPVEVVATASEYVPQSTMVSRPGHSYTNCLGSTDYFGRFDSYGGSGTFSGSAETRTHCDTIFTPPSESTLTTYRRVNYTIARGDNSLYLLACTQTWKLTGRERALLGVMGAAEGGSGNNSDATDRARANARGKWTDCPAFGIGSRYALTVRNTSDARLEDAYGTKPVKLEYLSSAPLPTPASLPAPERSSQGSTDGQARVHITSSPTGGEIYIDGKFFGNTPSDITLAAGEHTVLVTAGGREWQRVVQVTAGEISVHADIFPGSGR